MIKSKNGKFSVTLARGRFYVLVNKLAYLPAKPPTVQVSRRTETNCTFYKTKQFYSNTTRYYKANNWLNDKIEEITHFDFVMREPKRQDITKFSQG